MRRSPAPDIHQFRAIYNNDVGIRAGYSLRWLRRSRSADVNDAHVVISCLTPGNLNVGMTPNEMLLPVCCTAQPKGFPASGPDWESGGALINGSAFAELPLPSLNDFTNFTSSVIL